MAMIGLSGNMLTQVGMFDVLGSMTPIYDTGGKLAQEFLNKIENIVSHYLEHHPKTHPVTIAGKEIVITEQALDTLGHYLRLTVMWSPQNGEGKALTLGMSFDNSGSSARQARAGALSCFEAVVKDHYKK